MRAHTMLLSPFKNLHILSVPPCWFTSTRNPFSTPSGGGHGAKLCDGQTHTDNNSRVSTTKNMPKWCLHDLRLSQWCQNVGLCNLKQNFSGASIALSFNEPKRMESYKNEKSNILTPKFEQISINLFHYLFWTVSESLKFTCLIKYT